VVLAAEEKVLRSVLITGDFFAFPERLVYDLEAELKNVPLDEDVLRRRLERFFNPETGRSTPGVTPEDFLRAILRAAERTGYRDLGLADEEANDVYAVAATLSGVRGAKALLLPYCAKPTWCQYRHRDGCSKCDGRRPGHAQDRPCTIGEAYRLAESHGLLPISINNYEQLEETLEDLKARGVPAFVGACCGAFYQKHQRDFEEAGLPGVLVDIDDVTCYDLGQEGAAHEGKFEKETSLRLDLRRKVLDLATDAPAKDGRSADAV
jgi:lipoate-protein ligase A